MLLNCYFIVLVLFSLSVWYFGYNSVLALFIYLSLFTQSFYILIIIIYFYIIYFYLKNDKFVNLIFFSIF